ncbi:MAG: hypothetical protein AAF757_07000 [Cyanobacteria bacterium P01_D01_bin.116]
MKAQFEYSPAEVYKLQKIKHVIQDVQKQLLEIEQHLKTIKQNYPSSELEQFSHGNNSKTE